MNINDYRKEVEQEKSTQELAIQKYKEVMNHS